MKQTGKLTSEQFALAMWLIQQKIAGVDPPSTLTPEMIPPTMRPKPATEPPVSGPINKIKMYSFPIPHEARF